jgi:prepilin-type N-terminal cleavage/methylation domain-containing protein
MKEKGFTLVELMVAMAIGLVIMATIYASVNMAQRSATSVVRKVSTQQDARAVLDIMAMEIRMAGYNPKYAKATWANGLAAPLCSAMTLISVNKGIQVATANKLVIVMDLNGSGIIADADNEYIMYEYNGVDTINRSMNCIAASAFLGGNTDSTTQVRNADAGVPLFQYFDRTGGAAASILDIRRIRITIVADTKTADSLSSKKPKRMIYSTDVMVKNHVLCN